MKKALPPYVYRRKGGLYYYERRGHKSQRIHAEPGTREFALEYAKILNGVQPAPVGKTFKALVKSYRESKRYAKLAPRTARDYEKVLAWVEAKLGDKDATKIQRKDVIRARDANADAARFASYIVQVLRILMEHAIDLGWRQAHDNPAKGVELIKADTDEREAWPVEKIEAFRAAADGRTLLIFELCLGTGQRIGDVLRMRWDDIEDGGIKVRQGKTGARLWLPLTARLREVLDATPRRGLTICAWGNAGKPTSYRGAADMVMKVRKKIGAEAWDLHGLRYAAAAELAALGCDDGTIQAITGHKTLAMVARYAGPARQKARAKKAQEMRE
ncbi:integrase [Cereibacter sphaeroides]|uniref:Integrase n=1 Tax=Cereibacter sphaeroides TaxID=1063 RepID=A0AAX1UP24_CERSP|nr:tyrosine-type recombinase/integrase [Cereibacter sphaeroides]RHZ96507.1 integrase [Cereibacter sphaeroides]